MTIDPLTGAITEIGTTGINTLNSVVHVRTVPEPASLGLAVIGGVLLVAFRRWTHRQTPGQ